MNSLFSKLSLYDILAQLIPGLVLVCEVLYVLGIPYTSPYIIIGSLVFGYLLGLALHSFGELLWDKCHFRNNPEAIRDAFYKCKLYNEYSLNDEIHAANDDRLIDIYYKAYYYVCDIKQHGKKIAAMEQHIAFIRSMLIPLLCSIFVVAKYLCVHGLSICYCQPWYVYLIMVVLLLVIVSLVYTIWNKQRKIYQCVWEDYEYLKRLEETTVCIRTKQTEL